MSPHWRWPTRLRPAFSLRSLLLAITLTACVLGYRIMPEPWQLRFFNDLYWSDVVISPDGELIATGEYDSPRISVWQTSTGKELFRFESPINRVVSNTRYDHGLCFADNGRRLLCGNGIGLVNYDLATGRQSPVTPTAGWQYLFSPEGRRVAAYGSSSTIDVFEPDHQRMVVRSYQFEDEPIQLYFSPDSSVLLVRTRDHYESVPLESGEQRSKFKLPPEYQDEPHDYAFHCVAIAPSNRRITISNGLTILVYRRDQEQPVSSVVMPEEIHISSLAWSPDSNTLAVGGSKKGIGPCVTVFHGESGEVLWTRAAEAVIDVHFDTLGEEVVATDSRDRVAWDVETGNLVSRFKPPENEAQFTRIFSRENNTIVAQWDGIRIWQRNYPEHWQPWLRRLYIALTSLAALAMVASLTFDQRRRQRALQPPAAATVAT